jgi:tRNA (guanine-N7-)-methyltransferase
MVIEHYGLNAISDIQDLYKSENILPELNIKTHYENLDIAKSKTVFYLCFTLPEVIIDNDIIFNQLVKNEDFDINEAGIKS